MDTEIVVVLILLAVVSVPLVVPVNVWWLGRQHKDIVRRANRARRN